MLLYMLYTLSVCCISHNEKSTQLRSHSRKQLIVAVFIQFPIHVYRSYYRLGMYVSAFVAEDNKHEIHPRNSWNIVLWFKCLFPESYHSKFVKNRRQVKEFVKRIYVSCGGLCDKLTLLSFLIKQVLILFLLFRAPSVSETVKLKIWICR